MLQGARKVIRPAHWRLAEALPLPARRHYLLAVGTGRWGDFTDPVTYSEKVQWRILNDRRERIVMACDKLAMKEHVASLGLGDLVRIPRTLWSGSDLATMPDPGDWPDWVLKPNHGCGDVILGPVPREEIAARTVGWLRSRPGEQLGEWGYTQARALILAEERVPAIRDSPNDYKFFVFDGEPVVIQVNSARFTPQPRLTFYDPSWRRLDVADTRMPPGREERPAMLDRMVELAARLGAGWDHIRVDFYATDDEVWFGEFSPYPGGGVARFKPRDFDVELGRRWRLPERDLATFAVMDARP